MKKRCCRVKGGFSLVEVCLAVLVVGLGLMSIFAMFPTGLAASESAAADTETGLFAEQVLWGLQAASAELSRSTNWSDWNANKFVVKDVDDTTEITMIPPPGVTTKSKANIQYALTFASPTSRVNRVKEVTLSAASMKASPVVTNVYYTEIYYMELP